MKTSSDVLPPEAASRLAEYQGLVRQALPGVERMILFGSRARGMSPEDSDYDIAVLVSDLSDARSVRGILSDLAYDHVLSGFFIRPIPLSSSYLDPPEGNATGNATELAEEIARDGVEVG
jgi:predicted nucleotidyltransferase